MQIVPLHTAFVPIYFHVLIRIPMLESHHEAVVDLSWNMRAQSGIPVSCLNSQVHLKHFGSWLAKSL